MTPQEHIDAIGEALNKTEKGSAALSELIESLPEGPQRDGLVLAYKRLKVRERVLHKRLDQAQRAYSETHADNDLALYSTEEGDDAPGGTNKPDPNDPDPVEP